MTPDQIAKSGSEHSHQAALFCYLAVAKLYGWRFADYWALGECNLPHQVGGPNVGKPVPNYEPVPELQWFHAIHNQGHGDAIRGGKAKAEGVRKGIADTFLPVPNRWNGLGGLYIEMKKPSEKPKTLNATKGGLSDEQIEFKNYCLTVGYSFATCYSWREAANTLRSYIEHCKR